MPLDGLSATVLGAWSVSDRLSSSYTSNLLRCRRLSDGAEVNIGYTGANVVDTAAIASHCSGTTGYVKTLYDQSGNGRDLSNTDNAQLPVIYAAGAVLIAGTQSTPCMRLDPSTGFGSADGRFLEVAGALGLSGNPGLNLWWNWIGGSDTTDRFIFSCGSQGGGSCYGWMTSQASQGRLTGSTTADTRDLANPSSQTWGYYQGIYAASTTINGANPSALRNGVALTQQNAGAGSTPNIGADFFKIGTSNFNNDSFSADGRVSTTIALATVVAGDTTALGTWYAARN